MKKILLVLGGLVLLVVIALVLFVFFGLGAAIKAAVEGVGSRATGTDVTLKSADVSITNGDGRLTGLVVGNPKGFKTPSAFEMDDIHVTLDTSTVGSDTIVVKEVVIEGPRVTYDVSSGGSNIAAIQANVDAFSSGFGGGDSGGDHSGGKKPAESKPAPAAGEKSGGKKFVITDFYVRNGKITLAASILGGTKLPVPLSEIHIHNLGKAEGGATSAEIAKEVLGSLTSGVLKSVANAGISVVNGGVDTIKGGVGGAVDKVKNLFGGGK